LTKSSLSFRSGIVEQKEDASERENRLLTTLAAHNARVTFPRCRPFSRSLAIFALARVSFSFDYPWTEKDDSTPPARSTHISRLCLSKLAFLVMFKVLNFPSPERALNVCYEKHLGTFAEKRINSMKTFLVIFNAYAADRHLQFVQSPYFFTARSSRSPNKIHLM